MRRIPKLVLVPLLALVASPALAGQSPQSTTFTVTATVTKGCRISAGDLDLGKYDPSDTTDTTPTSYSTISVNCTKNTDFTVAMPSTNKFQMTNASESLPLNYVLYQESGRKTNWATNSAPGHSNSANTAVQFYAYGTIPKGQDVGEGTYTDTVTVQVTFN